MEQSAKQIEFEQLKARVAQLEAELQTHPSPWQPQGEYPAYEAVSGFVLGIAGASVALLVNVIAAPMAGKDPLQLIRVYLTFPLGEKALSLGTADGGTHAISEGAIFQPVLRKFADRSFFGRVLLASVLSLVVWVVGFYGILSWLQPATCGGNWITDNSVLPWWVAAVKHLIFGLTMAILYPLGRFRQSAAGATKA
ncbi:MAG: hypothetical protein NT069_15380 [Planctomycetota bacterium]|nr:hypothetical protein [Planctomycetota bacterium]